jgi:hypothetical protein
VVGTDGSEDPHAEQRLPGAPVLRLQASDFVLLFLLAVVIVYVLPAKLLRLLRLRTPAQPRSKSE